MKTIETILREKTGQPDSDQLYAASALEGLRRAAEAEEAKKGSLFRIFPSGARKTARRGFYMWGGVGRGKTLLMDIFFSVTAVTKKRRVHFNAFMLEVHDFLHLHAHGGGVDAGIVSCARHMAADARLLCLDEFQVTDVADAMILQRLFTALFENGVIVVVTSNAAPDDLYRDGLQRDRFLPFIALLKERLSVLHFGGVVDYRLLGLKKGGVYFFPHDEPAMRELEKIFETLAGSAGAPDEIDVKGRVIRIPRAGNGVAMFSFHDLCEEPKSALDYLEIVKKFNTLVVSDVPRLDGKGHDVVLRFIALVDTVYDNRARLIISAAAAPADLRGGDAPWTLDRAISRLVEMQSQGYAV